MRSTPEIEAALKRAASSGFIKYRTENNQHLKVSYQGAGPITPKWNVKIYNSGALVTNDSQVIDDLVAGKALTASKDLQLLSIDDAGVGFPLCGVMVGISDGSTVLTDTIPATFFQGISYEKKFYLKAYSAMGQELVKRFKGSPSTHRIEICTGHINTRLKEDLRILGYDVRVTEIQGLLQNSLEDLYKDHIRALVGKDIGYDPKALRTSQVVTGYNQAVEYGRKHCPHLLKSGWKSLN